MYIQGGRFPYNYIINTDSRSSRSRSSSRNRVGKTCCPHKNFWQKFLCGQHFWIFESSYITSWPLTWLCHLGFLLSDLGLLSILGFFWLGWLWPIALATNMLLIFSEFCSTFPVFWMFWPRWPPTCMKDNTGEVVTIHSGQKSSKTELSLVTCGYFKVSESHL